MELLDLNEFAEWVRQHVAGVDGWGGPPHAPEFSRPTSASRFWCTRNAAHEELYTVASILQALDPWEKVWAWKNDPTWSFVLDDEDSPDPRYIWSTQHVWANIVHGLGIPQNFRGVIGFHGAELHVLLTLLFAQMHFGGCVDDDVFVLPDHGKQIVMISHHDVIHVSFVEGSRVDKFVDDLAREGIQLPDRPPDQTFKIPDWMSTRK